MPLLDFFVRLSAALLRGVCAGLERQWRPRSRRSGMYADLVKA
jgi:uncharacterized membrane protein YhiD involved in acid resistance